MEKMLNVEPNKNKREKTKMQDHTSQLVQNRKANKNKL